MMSGPIGLHSPYVTSYSDASYIRKKSVTDLYKQMKEQHHHQTPTRSLSTAANLTSLCVDISPSCSNFFEVLYIGKTKGWQKKVPNSFIDDALQKIKAHESERNKQIGLTERLLSENDITRRGSQDSSISEPSGDDSDSRQVKQALPTHPPLLRSQSYHVNLVQPKISDANDGDDSSDDSNRQFKPESQQDSASSSIPNEDKTRSESVPDLKSPVGIDDFNRTMVLQVDRTDLRLISPDRKVILLHKHHKDVTTCVQGQTNSKYFGFICKEGNAETYVGYIFKCESSSIASDAVAAITQAFLSSESRMKQVVTSCEHCPMVWFHKLCVEIEQLSDRKTQAAILRRLEQLDEDEQNTILTKFRGAETDSVKEQNEFLMMLLRAHCEMKQGRHVHDTAENRSEFLSHHLGGSTIFNKAKRSLTNSFDQLLKRKGSRDDFGSSLRNLNLPITNNLNREHSPSPGVDQNDSPRSRSSIVESHGELNHLQVKDNQKDTVSPERSTGSDKGLKSPMMDIFLKVGNSPKSASSEDSSPNRLDAGSWRQAIFKRVVTPNKIEKSDQPPRKRSKEELKILWKKSIYQTILLVRMEKENARLKAKQEESAVKRIKLEYDEMKPTLREGQVFDVWELLTSKEGARVKCDQQKLLHAIRQGVPRGKRGEVWMFLAEQFCARVAPMDTAKFPNYNVPYDTLLKQLTSHHHAHAILIDLGRTFPNHSYFSSPLGPGQLALFNLLKAYSLLDPEVGYCQGLSFVAGVLLLHMEEHQAFFLLRHLMFRRGMRQQYLPDMVSLQVKLYQLSRLLHDQLPELYNHFDLYEVAPTLYAAPWILTVFASQFPLGFVTRVFDLIFLEGADVIFRIALALLTYHKDKLLHCDSFEEIMNYLKEEFPNIEKPTLEKLMKQVYTTDISKQLNEYKVEYQVLHEEMTSVQPQMEALHKLEVQNRTITDQNKSLLNQLESSLANVQRLEKTRVLQQSQLNRLEMQNRALNVTIATLGNFVNELVEQKLDIEIPDDVRRILSQISLTERRQSELKLQQNNLLKMFQRPENSEKIMVKSLSTGKIDIPERKEFRANSLKTQTIVEPNLKTQQEKSPTTSTERISKFFSSSHNTILQQRLNCQNSIYNNAKIDITVQEVDDNMRNSEKSNSLPLAGKSESKTDSNKNSPTNSVDSGLSTPSSPRLAEPHPLSNCDVTFTYNGTRELKNIKSITRNASQDITTK
ncbi:unnamed protein product [Callosobruchus maculatus]|uniref:Rab-GAP TBC domain-containing protein n=1 Tax=Callosobruchus maculatus TaxID=64391 RepID=A0A653C3Q2_CALMS|nr:unnamed protein product [Callosobruchus maculatus]